MRLLVVTVQQYEVCVLTLIILLVLTILMCLTQDRPALRTTSHPGEGRHCDAVVGKLLQLRDMQMGFQGLMFTYIWGGGIITANCYKCGIILQWTNISASMLCPDGIVVSEPASK